MIHADSRTPSALSLSDLNTSVNHEPRILDLRIAERLSFARPRKVRDIIERNRAELESHGPLVSDEATTHGGTRPTAGRVYWLNEAQTLLICMFSKTAAAASVRKEVIEVYMAYRHHRASAAKAPPRPSRPARLPRPPSLRDKRLLVAECRKLYGEEAAQLMWSELGLPQVAPSFPVLSAPGRLDDGIGMAVIRGQRVWYDANDLGFREADCVVICGDGLRLVRVTRETAFDGHPRHWRRRSGMGPWQPSPHGGGHMERVEVRIVGRVIGYDGGRS